MTTIEKWKKILVSHLFIMITISLHGLTLINWCNHAEADATNLKSTITLQGVQFYLLGHYNMTIKLRPAAFACAELFDNHSY